MQLCKLYSTAEVADYLGYNRAYFYRLIVESPEKVPPFVLVGKTRRWREPDIEAFLADQIKK